MGYEPDFKFKSRWSTTRLAVITSPLPYDRWTVGSGPSQEFDEKVARLIESEIIAYSLFGLDKFALLKAQVDGQEIYLPAGRMGTGNYLLPVGYVAQRVTGQRVNLRGEVIRAANKWVEIPEAERLVASLRTLQGALGSGAVQDVRFEE